MSKSNDLSIETIYLVEARGQDPMDQWGYYHDSTCTSRKEARKYVREKRSTEGNWPEHLRIVRFVRDGVAR